MSPFIVSLAFLTLFTDQTRDLGPGERVEIPIDSLKAGATYRLDLNIEGPVRQNDRFQLRLIGPGSLTIRKFLHAGDGDIHVQVRPLVDGDARLAVGSESASDTIRFRAIWAPITLEVAQRTAIEAEPNDSWREANPLVLGRTVHGTADDVDYLENRDEGRSGIDWFRFEITETSPILVFFQLELLDRDVSANLRIHRLSPTGDRVEPEEAGKDPTEIVHDRERERYSTHLSRTLGKGIYFAEVNANHPDYLLKTRTFPLPPYRDPGQAVEVGLDYLLQVGDAWFAQVPREGNIFTRANNLHDTATRCTACHASSFPTEASLIAHAKGYPIRAKSSMRYLMDRLANSPTPLYGNDGLYWQRFIAIPLQSQGKQGGIILDFENQVLGRKTIEFERFGPFLQAAWRGRRSLPGDEMNGVLPLDSKFGFAWRDWRVLTEMIQRTGRVSYAQAADTIADILSDSETDREVETLQDRIHRLHAWTLIDPTAFAGRIKTEAEALFSLQNPDGGWHELDKKPGPSAVYTTGQIAWTLQKAGYTRDDPRVARALAYLLASQQSFGGWFQTSTHENFRTPMRETRYAIEALAEAFPRPGAPLKGWGNVDEQPARIPRQDSIVHTLDDLENLWDVPEFERARFANVIVPLLDHDDPLVRSQAAACLGRLGDASAVEALIARLGDGSKIVWRSAAWALRKLGNQGIGVEAIAKALASPDPAVRRGATRIFASQFSGMDGRSDLAQLLIDRVEDPDLWTRLQALRSLRQWFYRTNDAKLRRNIIDVYLKAMSLSDVPVVRKALSEGLYILLDENLGGGVSLQKNLAVLPEKFRRNALKGREDVERDILLGPILSALESGNALQREALLRSFDGSFFRGRGYARQPTGMIDVGNDREFGFLYEVPSSVLERTFAALLTDGSTPEIRRRSIQLASFFLVPGRTADPTIQSSILRGLSDADPGVCEVARSTVAESLGLQGAEDDDSRMKLIVQAIQGPEAGRRAISRSIARSQSLLTHPRILGEIRRLTAAGQTATILPLLSSPAITEAELVASVGTAWKVAVESADRIAMLDTLLARPTLLESETHSSRIGEVLESAARDPSIPVRLRTLETIGEHPRLAASLLGTRLLLASLFDDNPSIRRQGLKIAMKREDFWVRADASERLHALLIDPDRRIREQALACVENLKPVEGSVKLARRLKALAEQDTALEARADAEIVRRGFDPRVIEADAKAGRRILSLASFRDKINPLFYKPGEDGVSCARCHATHNVLRITERDPSVSGDIDDLLINYRSALKVVNLGDPESSLLLRKPSSPAGQGGPEPSSGTGLTHVGGTRWDHAEHPAYLSILSWIRETSTADPTQTKPTLSSDSFSPGFEPGRADDGDPSTYWQTEFVGANPGYPHEFTIDLGRLRRVDGLRYVPRQDQSTGRVKEFEVQLSTDGKSWTAVVARGIWPDDPSDQWVILPGQVVRYVKLRGLSEVNGSTSMSAAEVEVDARELKE